MTNGLCFRSMHRASSVSRYTTMCLKNCRIPLVYLCSAVKVARRQDKNTRSDLKNQLLKVRPCIFRSSILPKERHRLDRIQIAVGRDIVVVEQKFRGTDERHGKRMRCEGRAVLWVIGIQKDDEFRIVGGKISEEGMEETVVIVSASQLAWTRKLRGACLCGDRVFGYRNGAAEERFVDDRNQHARNLVGGLLLQNPFGRRLRHLFHLPRLVSDLSDHVRCHRHTAVRKRRKRCAHIDRGNRDPLTERGGRIFD